MSYQLVITFSFSISIAAIIGLLRFNKINQAYYPFLYMIWIALLNEILGFIITHLGYSNSINDNVYALAESLLIIWQFKRWGLFKRTPSLFMTILVCFGFGWVIDSFLNHSIGDAITYFRIFYSFVIVLMSINIINEQLVREKRNLLKNAIFLICITFVIYYTYAVFFGVFWKYGLQVSHEFRVNLISIFLYINFFANLLYALAILWMPTKKQFSLLS